MRSPVVSAARAGPASWIAAQRRGIRSHSRTYENVAARDGQDADENLNSRQTASGSSWDGFLLSSPRQVCSLLSHNRLWALLDVSGVSSFNTWTRMSSDRSEPKRSSLSPSSTTITGVRRFYSFSQLSPGVHDLFAVLQSKQSLHNTSTSTMTPLH